MHSRVNRMRAGNEIPVRKRDRQCCALTRQQALDLRKDEFQGNVVAYDVVNQHRQITCPACATLHEMRGHQGRLLQINLHIARVGGIEQFRKRIVAVCDVFKARQLRFPQDHLNRMRQTMPAHGTAQDVMPSDHDLQGIEEFVQARATVKFKRRSQQIGVAGSTQHVVKQQAFL